MNIPFWVLFYEARSGTAYSISWGPIIFVKSLIGCVPLWLDHGDMRRWCPLSLPCRVQLGRRRLRNASVDRQEHQEANTFFKFIIHTYHHLHVVEDLIREKRKVSASFRRKKVYWFIPPYRITDDGWSNWICMIRIEIHTRYPTRLKSIY